MDAFAEDWNESQFWVCVTGYNAFSILFFFAFGQREMGGDGGEWADKR